MKDRLANGYRPYLDGLRGVAIALVIGYHVHLPGFGGGYFGVDIFFVISGYLITSLLLAEIDGSGNVRFASFYARRLRRLLPAFAVMVAASLIGGWCLVSAINGARGDLSASAVWALLGLSNAYFFLNGGGYFDGLGDERPLLHTWSLGVEEQYYLFWPLMLWCIARLCQRDTTERYARVVLVAGCIMSYAVCVWYSAGHDKAVFFLTPARAWELGVGALVALLARRAVVNNPVGRRLAFAGGFLLLTSMVVAALSPRWPSAPTLIPVLAAAATIYGCEVSARNGVKTILSWRPLVFLGLISYSLYLWHWPVLALARSSSLVELGPLATAELAILTVVVSIGSYRYVELPFRHGDFVISLGAKRTVGYGALAIAGCIVAVAGVKALGFDDARSSAEAEVVSAAQDRSPGTKTCQAAWTLPARLPEPAVCTFPKAKDRAVRVGLWGDSHAISWLPALEVEAGKRGFSAYVATMDSCPPLIGFAPGVHDARHDENCGRFNAAVLDRFRQMSKIGLRGAVLGAYWGNYGSSDDVSAGLDRTLKAAQDLGLRVVVIAPVPTMPYSVPACLRVGAVCDLPRAEFEKQRSAALGELNRIVASYPNARLWDPGPLLCDDLLCSARLRGVVAYTDRSHVSASAAAALASEWRPLLLWLVGDDLASAAASEAMTHVGR